MTKIQSALFPTAMAGLIAIAYLGWNSTSDISDAEKIGVCEAQAWLTGTRGRETTAWQDHLWAAAIVGKFRDNANVRGRICMGMDSAGS